MLGVTTYRYILQRLLFTVGVPSQSSEIPGSSTCVMYPSHKLLPNNADKALLVWHSFFVFIRDRCLVRRVAGCKKLELYSFPNQFWYGLLGKGNPWERMLCLWCRSEWLGSHLISWLTTREHKWRTGNLEIFLSVGVSPQLRSVVGHA